MARQIFAAEISHEDTPLAIREKLAANETTVKNHLCQLSLVTDEVFILSTCNRFTIYAVNDSIDPLTHFFDQYPSLKGYVQYYYNTEESVTHLFAVASGLLSPIKGDHRILEQLKQAHQWSRETNTLGITLDNFLRQAQRIGKRVRTETGIDKFCVSVVDAGIELLYQRMDTVHNKKVLVVGTGKIARMAIKYLYNEGIQDVTIVSHDAGRAHELACQFYYEADNIDNVQELVKKADIVIGATHHEVALFPDSYLSGFFEHLKQWFILDFGMPRNFNSKLADQTSIELYNLDDMKRLHHTPLDDFGGIEGAWTIVMREAKSFMEVLLQLEFSPVLVAYWNRMMYIKNRELNLLMPKLDDELSAVDIQRIKLQAHKLIRNMSGDITKNTRTLVNNLQASNARSVVENLNGMNDIKFNLSMN